MTTQEIKRKIDSARDILVGKVPDPKAQVDQITNALIYKFMDDMDKESMSLPKGKPQFFTNGYEKYAWSKLMDPKIGGHERLNIYGEAIAKMSQNPHLPQLFRDIFKDAFLPYRDPETLSLFLKEINGFTYGHSEDLGNAFEYLLSVLGSQGEAGQFRTPRHIIDFIIEVVDPKKDESILDPACGTAGFLISTYKHILKANKEKPLTPDEKKRLMKNLVGYDISPDMVKLSLVNMYLHGFPSPHIYEYDTLTSEEHWDERFDVIMANPPFMTPKGGIRPHRRFMVQASRAEVLFVDYMIEHLNSNGRIGIIVPEGVIANANASYYTAIRKLLVNNGLWAIVSLHSYVFAPYAEVTTFVLFIDKKFSSLNDHIIFLDVKNDGFDKSDQRRKIDLNDLPEVKKILEQYKHNLSKGVNRLKDIPISKIKEISKKDVEQSEDYVLLSSRYQEIEFPKTAVPVKELGLLIVESKERSKDNHYEVWSVSNRMGFVLSKDYFDKKVASENTQNYKLVKPNCFAFNPSRVNVGSIACNLSKKTGIVSPMYTVFRIKDELEVSKEYLLLYLKSDFCLKQINHKIQGATRKVLKKNDLQKLKIPVPPIKVQEIIIKEIAGEKQKIYLLQKEIETYNRIIESKISKMWKGK